MKSSTKRGLLVVIACLVVLPAAAYVASPGVRQEVRSLYACNELGGHGFRGLAAERQNRFLGKVQEYTAECRGGSRLFASPPRSLGSRLRSCASGGMRWLWSSSPRSI